MGKKGGAKKAAPKKGGQGESKAEFDAMLAQLAESTKNNSGLAQEGKDKFSKKERREKLKQIKKDKEEKVQDQIQQRQQMKRLMDMIKMLSSGGGDYREEPNTEKDIEEKESEELLVTSVGMQGWRQSMEDAHIVQLPGDDQIALYGVFDGHSGSDAAKYAADHLEEVLRAQDGWAARDFEPVLRAGFMKIDADMKEKSIESGSTATVVLVDHQKNKIYCANAGDSRAVMSVGGKCVPLSEDHKPNAPVEQARIEKAGGTVDDTAGVPRVNGCLAVSRGFGDFTFKGAEDIAPEDQAVTANPDITVHDLTKDTQFIAIACDGIWDCLTSEEVVDKLQEPFTTAEKVGSMTETVNTLFHSILAERPQGYGTDNMSLIGVRFNKHCQSA